MLPAATVTTAVLFETSSCDNFMTAQESKMADIAAAFFSIVVVRFECRFDGVNSIDVYIQYGGYRKLFVYLLGVTREKYIDL